MGRDRAGHGLCGLKVGICIDCEIAKKRLLRLKVVSEGFELYNIGKMKLTVSNRMSAQSIIVVGLIRFVVLFGDNFHTTSALSNDMMSRRDALWETSFLTTTSAIRTPKQVVRDAGSSVAQPAFASYTCNNNIVIPSVAYSFYKAIDRIEECVNLALHAGVRQLDCATQYANNPDIGTALQKQTIIARDGIFIAHKLSNSEQSTSIQCVKRNIKQACRDLQTSYLDLGMIHSPLTDSTRRLVTYQALQELQQDGIVRCVGVCHYGVRHLQEIIEAGLSTPQVIQLQLSPFHAHNDVASWAHVHNSRLACSAWSRLSSVDGPAEGWTVVQDLAKEKGVTKAQILVRWALAKQYICAPKSTANSKLERDAIAENSYNACHGIRLTRDELDRLDRLDVQLPAGQLRVTDGYDVDDIRSREWDPTNVV